MSIHKHLFLSLFLISISYNLKSQDINDHSAAVHTNKKSTNVEISNHALGFRTGGSSAFETSLSYQGRLSGNTRLEINSGWSTSSLNSFWWADGAHQWIWAIKDGFQWYAGAGGALGFADSDVDDQVPLLRAIGIIGIEYSLKSDGVPILLAIDAKPSIALINNFGLLNLNFAFAARYQF